MNRKKFWTSLVVVAGLSSLPCAIPAASASVATIAKPMVVSAPNPTDCAESQTPKIKATIVNAGGIGIRRKVDFKFQVIKDSFTNTDYQLGGFNGQNYKSGLISEETASTTNRDGGIDVCGTDSTWLNPSSGAVTPDNSARLIAMVSSYDVEPTNIFPGVVAKDKNTDLVWFEDMGKNYGEFTSLNTAVEKTITIGSADIWGQVKLRDRNSTIRNAERILAQLYRVLPNGSGSTTQFYGNVVLRNGYFAFGNLPFGKYMMRVADNPCGSFLTVPCTDYYLSTKFVTFEINTNRAVTLGSGITRESDNSVTIQLDAANLNGSVVSALPTLGVTSIEYAAASPENYDWPVAIITTTTPAAVSQYAGVDLQGLPAQFSSLTGPQWIAQVIDDFTFAVWVKLTDQPAPPVQVSGVTAKILGYSTVTGCGSTPESTGWTGIFRMTIPTGACTLSITAPQGDPQSVSSTYAVVMNSDGSFTVNGGSTQSAFSQFDFKLSSGNFPIRLSDADGRPVVSSYMSLQPYTTSIPNCNNCRGWDYTQQIGGQTSGGGAFGTVIPDVTNKIYQLNIQPPFSGNNSYVQTQVVIRASAAAGVLTKVEKCTAVFDTQAGTCSSWIELSPVNERYDFVIRGANVSGRLLSPTGENVAGTAYINVNKLGPVSYSTQSGKGWTWASAGPSKIGGTFGLSIDFEGSYWISAQAPYGESFPSLNTYVKAVGSGTSLQFFFCSGYDEPSGELTGCQTSAFDASSMVLQYPVPDLVGTVVNADGTTPSYAWVNVGVVSPGSCATCVSQWLSGASLSSGRFSLSFKDAGTYLLQINPAPNDTSGSVLSNFTATVTIAGGVKTVTVAGATAVNGIYGLQMKGANFKALLKGGNTIAKYAQVEVMKSTNGNWMWETWANADVNGKISLNLSDGKYKISPRPPSDLAATYASVTVFAYVNTTGGNTTTYLTATESCAVAQRAGGCTELSNTLGVYNIALGTPNISGYLATVAGVTRGGSGAPSELANAVSNAWIEAQKFNVMNQNYEWTPLVAGSSSGFDGAFAFNLPEGRWRLAVNVPPATNTAGLAKKNFDFTVASNGTVTCDAAYQFCQKDASPSSGRFDLHLASANLSGTVTAAGAGVSAAEMRAEKWNGNYWQWVNLYTQASQASATVGQYGFNLDTTGVYKISAQIPQWKPNTGFSANSIYVYRDTNKVCLVANEDDAKSASSCTSGNSELTGANIALIGASIKGVVRDMNNALVGNSWVNVARFNTSGSYWQWQEGSQLNSLGQFNLSLKSSLGNTAATPERFRIEIYPPWNTTTLVKKTVDIWVGNFDQTNSEHEFVECSKEDFADCPVSTYARRAAGSTLNVSMGQGNIFGVITGPTGVELAQGPYINVEKWSVPSWSSSYMWNWADMNANANSEGAYRLDTQTGCPSGCFLRITANPASWSNTENWTRNSRIVHVAADGTWSSATQSAENEVPVSANSYSSGTLNISLRGSNITGVLKNAGSVVPYAWISLQKQEVGGWYRQIDGTSSNVNGTFGLSTEISGGGRFRLEVYPPWNSGLVRFTKEIVTTVDNINPDPFVLCAESTTNTADCNGSSTNFTLEYPQPNTVIKVCRKDESGTNCTGNKAVMNSWVTIYDTTTGSWLTGSNTEADGTVRFLLPNGSYRAEVMPPWNSLDGTRVEYAFTVSGGNVVAPTVTTPILSVDSTKTPNQVVVKLGSPNVSGFVKYRPNTTPVAMQNAWVQVRTTSGNYLPGASTNGSGKFELTLANGSYILTAYPNWNLAQRQQKDVAITVAGNTITTTGNGITWDGIIDFDSVAPNIDFVLEDIGLTPRQVFVQKLDNGNYFTVLVTASEPDITANTGRSAIKLLLPDGTYKMTIQKSAGDFQNGDSCRQSGEFTVSSDVLVSSTSIDAWKTGFNATNDVLACK
jgi:hypothetical protein